VIFLRFSHRSPHHSQFHIRFLHQHHYSDHQWLTDSLLSLLVGWSHLDLHGIHFLYDLACCTVYMSTDMDTHIVYGLAVGIYCRIRVKDVPCSADDGQIYRYLEKQLMCMIHNHYRERLRVDGFLTNCHTGDRIFICDNPGKSLPRSVWIIKYFATVIHNIRFLH
jgi:hypothetical protein